MLRDFAAYLKREHLTAVAEELLRLVERMDVPLLRRYLLLPRDELIAMAEAGMAQFLTELESRQALETAAYKMQLWERGELPGVPREGVEPSDLVLVYAVQKRALIAFLPRYTQDVEQALAIVNALEDYYQEVQKAAFQVFTRQQSQAIEAEARAAAAREAAALAAQAGALAEANRELELKNIELQSVDALKDEFISIVSHELRTPVNAITGFGSILADGVVGELTPEQLMYVQKMLAGADRLLALINDLLDYSRIKAGKFSLSFEPLDARNVVKDSLAILADQAQLKGLDLIYQDAPEPLMVQADAQRLGQILMNLLSNAIKFTPKGGRIEVRVCPDGEALRFDVEDTGPGIAPEDIPRLFKRFGQLDTGATRTVTGTGLGLAIVKNLVEAHDGQVGVDSQVGRGSRFWFRLPRWHEDPVVAPAELNLD